MLIFSSVNSFYFGISWTIETCISDSYRFILRMDAHCVEKGMKIQVKFMEKELVAFIQMHNDILR